MDSLIVSFLTELPHNKFIIANFILFLLGTILPILIGMVLPRKNTIKYGELIYKLLGGVMLQKRIQTPTINLLSKLLVVIRSTFVDLSFGVYIASRTDLSKKEKDQKTKEFLALTGTKG